VFAWSSRGFVAREKFSEDIEAHPAITGTELDVGFESAAPTLIIEDSRAVDFVTDCLGRERALAVVRSSRRSDGWTPRRATGDRRAFLVDGVGHDPAHRGEFVAPMPRSQRAHGEDDGARDCTRGGKPNELTVSASRGVVFCATSLPPVLQQVVYSRRARRYRWRLDNRSRHRLSRRLRPPRSLQCRT
jgi:hypothetical protein